MSSSPTTLGTASRGPGRQQITRASPAASVTVVAELQTAIQNRIRDCRQASRADGDLAVEYGQRLEEIARLLESTLVAIGSERESLQKIEPHAENLKLILAEPTQLFFDSLASTGFLSAFSKRKKPEKRLQELEKRLTAAMLGLTSAANLELAARTQLAVNAHGQAVSETRDTLEKQTDLLVETNRAVGNQTKLLAETKNVLEGVKTRSGRIPNEIAKITAETVKQAKEEIMNYMDESTNYLELKLNDQLKPIKQSVENLHGGVCQQLQEVKELVTPPPAPAPALEIPAINERLLSVDEARKLGEGSFSRVYAGKYNHEDVAVKIVRRAQDDVRVLLAVQREVRNLCVLAKYPGFVRLFGADIDSRKVELKLVLELAEGSLHALIHTQELGVSLTFFLKTSIALDIARALNALHEQRMIMCDLQPKNVLIFFKGRDRRVTAKLTGLGLVKDAAAGATSASEEGGVQGSIRYCAPELLRSNSQSVPYDFKSDVYALGVLLNEMMTGKKPFHEFAEDDDDDGLRGHIRSRHRPELFQGEDITSQEQESLRGSMVRIPRIQRELDFSREEEEFQYEPVTPTRSPRRVFFSEEDELALGPMTPMASSNRHSVFSRSTDADRTPLVTLSIDRDDLGSNDEAVTPIRSYSSRMSNDAAGAGDAVESERCRESNRNRNAATVAARQVIASLIEKCVEISRSLRPGISEVVEKIVAARSNISEDEQPDTVNCRACGTSTQVDPLFLNFIRRYCEKAKERNLSPLFLACSQGNIEGVSALLHCTQSMIQGESADVQRLLGDSLAARVNKVERGKNECVPLHVAAENGFTDIVYLLLTHAANVNASDGRGWTSLHLAALKGHTEIVSRLFAHNVNIEAKDKALETPLHLAMRFGHEPIVSLLLTRGANANAENNNGCTPLHIAVGHGHTAIVNFLLSRGAIVDAADLNGWTPLHCGSFDGHIEIVRCLLDYEADVDATNESLDTPLHLAARCGHREVVTLLLRARANVEARNNNGATPLDVSRSEEIKALLLGALPPPPIIEQFPPSSLDALTLEIIRRYCASAKERNLSPLYLACRHGDLDGARALLQCTFEVIQGESNDVREFMSISVPLRVNKVQRDQYTPLHVSAENGHEELVKLLLSNGAMVDARTSRQWTALHLVAFSGHTEIAPLLLDNRANVGAKNMAGDTPLHLASRLGHEGMVSLLISHRANVFVENDQGATPLDCALNNSIRALLSQGLSPLDPGVDLESLKVIRHYCAKAKERNLSPLYLACRAGDLPGVAALLHSTFNLREVEHRDVREFIGESVALRVNKVEYRKDERTPLHAAADYGHTEIVSLLIRNRANLETKDSFYWTPLHLVARKGHTSTADLLLESNADPGSKNEAGDTPLHLAARHAHKEIVALLILHNANVDIKNNQGLTPWDCCRDREIKAMLRNDTSVEVDSERINAIRRYIEKAERETLSPLFLACEEGNIEAANNLLQSTSNLVHNDNETVLQFLAETKDERVNKAEEKKNGYSPLHIAANGGHTGIVNFLICHKAKLDVFNWDQETPLHIACRNGHTEIVSLLLKEKANIEAINRDQRTPLHIAGREGNANVVSLLLAHGANLDAKDGGGQTALDLTTDEKVRLLLRNAVEEVRSPTRGELQRLNLSGRLSVSGRVSGRMVLQLSPVHSASEMTLNDTFDTCDAFDPCDTCDPSDIQLDVSGDFGESLTPREDEQSEIDSPLMGSEDRIFESFFSPQCLERMRHYFDLGKTKNLSPLYLAAEAGDEEVVRALLDDTLHEKVQNESEEVQQFAQTSVIYRVNRVESRKNRFTPLHIASYYGRNRIVFLLLSRHANVEAKDKYEETPLHVAARREHAGVLSVLLTHNANIDAKNKDDKRTPLHIAAYNGKTEAASLLITHNADIEALDKNKRTPLHIASRKGHEDTAELLLKHNADIEAEDEDQDTPLHIATRHGRTKTVELLLMKKAKTEATNKNLQTPMHIAAFHGHTEIIRDLLLESANIEAKDKNLYTPLHLAGHKGNQETFNFLLKNGANPEAEDKFGRKPYL